MTSTLDSINSALELDKVESHLHPEGSYEVEDHVVPTGREEIWRFTPLKRLRDLHKEADFTGALKATRESESGVTVETVPTAEVRGVSGFVPTDRIAARALAEARVVATHGLDGDVTTGDLDLRGAERPCRSSAVVQAAQPAQRGEPPRLVAATGHLERVHVERGEDLTLVGCGDGVLAGRRTLYSRHGGAH